ncbi:MAG: hypothetical protein RBS80_14535 [Thermoguttaceae bacterium]|jgi:hypothetical protein|nr:hypothetical protein [Thermoguttaceae bacterium]
MARVLLATYDPSHLSRDGSYWVWRSPYLTRELLERFYFDKSALFQPEDIRQLGEDDIWGGVTRLEQQWLCMCRYYNGGRDLRGRPGRFLLAVALVAMSDVIGRDVLPLFRNETFEWIAKNAAHCPLPEPPVLEQDIRLQLARPDPVQIARVLKELRVEYRGPDAARVATATALALPDDRPWNCIVRITARETIAVVERQAPSDQLPAGAEAERADQVPPEPAEKPKRQAKEPVQPDPSQVSGQSRLQRAAMQGARAATAIASAAMAFAQRHGRHVRIRPSLAVAFTALLAVAAVSVIWFGPFGLTRPLASHTTDPAGDHSPQDDGILPTIFRPFNEFLTRFGESLGETKSPQQPVCPSCAKLRAILIIGAAITLPTIAVMGYLLVRRR